MGLGDLPLCFDAAKIIGFLGMTSGFLKFLSTKLLTMRFLLAMYFKITSNPSRTARQNSVFREIHFANPPHK